MKNHIHYRIPVKALHGRMATKNWLLSSFGNVCCARCSPSASGLGREASPLYLHPRLFLIHPHLFLTHFTHYPQSSHHSPPVSHSDTAASFCQVYAMLQLLLRTSPSNERNMRATSPHALSLSATLLFFTWLFSWLACPL